MCINCELICMKLEMVDIEINTEFIKLDSFLKWCGAASLGSEAKMYILDEMVKVNGEICVQRGKKIRQGDIVEFNGEKYRVI
ncbi:S4 domain-containing protein YaaA [Clostridium sp. CTA-7]